MTPARMSLNCRDADERGDHAHVCTYCPGCPCHDAPRTGPRASRAVVEARLAEIRGVLAAARERAAAAEES